MRATTLSLGAPPETSLAIIRRVGEELELVNLRWGLRTQSGDPNGLRFVRSEGRAFPSHRCLLPASEFQVTRDGQPYRVELEDGNWFYLAGIWQPPAEGWPASFAILTVDTNREVARYQSRQGAFLRRNRQMAWLDHMAPEHEILVPPPDGIFTIGRADAGRQGRLAV